MGKGAVPERKVNYLTDLVSAVEKKKKSSMQSLSKIDMCSTVDVIMLTKWFDEIINLLNKSPPDKYVKCLRIKEDDSGMPESIAFEYYANKADGAELLFEIIENDQ